MSAYDEVPYATYSFPQTHPDRLAVIARLYGLHPAPVDRCRVLEIGCGDGGNLVPMGWLLPESEFVGVDLASRAIVAGNEMLRDLAVANVRLLHADIAAVDASWGSFDYIIAHGFYSWVPAATRDHLFRICAECLAEEGVAFVSYNAYPGCHLRRILRDAMLFHARSVSGVSGAGGEAGGEADSEADSEAGSEGSAVSAGSERNEASAGSAVRKGSAGSAGSSGSAASARSEGSSGRAGDPGDPGSAGSAGGAWSGASAASAASAASTGSPGTPGAAGRAALPSERSAQAKALLSLLAAAQSGRDGVQTLLKELHDTLAHSDAHLYHDDLAEINDPVYFTQFMEHARMHGLQYLAEADYFEMSDHTFPADVREALQKIGRDRIAREQYLDFLKFRRFRQTLLCRREAALFDTPDSSAIADFYVASPATSDGRRTAGNTVVFETPKGARVETDFAIGIEALAELQQRWPESISMPELASAVASRLARTREEGSNAEEQGGGAAGAGSPALPREESEIREGLCGFLLSLYAAGAVEFHTHVPPSARGQSTHPMTSPVARWQLERGNIVTTLRHDNLQIQDELGKTLLRKLDGTRDRAALRDELYEVLKAERAFVDGVPEAQGRERVADALDRSLSWLAEAGLLLRVGGGRWGGLG